MRNEAKEEIRARLNIEDVVGEYVQLKRAGRNFKGLSPFNDEKTPSFVVSPDKQIWHDFSSNRGGDVFSFVMEAEGIDFREALEKLARKAGIDLTIYQHNGDRGIAAKKKRLFEMNRLAAHYFQSCLVRNPVALDYVSKVRHLDRGAIADFMIGYAPNNGDALIKALTKKGFSTQELRDSGLVNRYGSDLFRERLMIPLSDTAGQVIGFTGRIVTPVDNAPKYLNTPDTVLFDKGRHVFGLFQAKEAIRKQGFAVVVEGNLDVVSSHQADVRNVVATAGTAMTIQHLKTLKRFTSDIRLCFDADRAGIAATERAIGLASDIGIELSIVSVTGGAKDPDELIQQDVQLWQAVVTNPIPAVQWVIDRYSEREDLASASGKKSFVAASLALIERLGDVVEREHYEKVVAERVQTTLETIRARGDQFGAASIASPTKMAHKISQETSISEQFLYEDDLLALAWVDLECRDLLVNLDLSLLTSDSRRLLAEYLQTHPKKKLNDVPRQLQGIEKYVRMVTSKADTRYDDTSSENRFIEAVRLIRKIEHEHLKKMRDHLTAELRQAESTGDDERAKKLLSDLNLLIKEIARGK